MTPCRDVMTVGWREYACRLSGVTVMADCAEGGDCIPHKALRYLAGTLDINALPPEERKAVEVMVERIAETAGPQDMDGMTEAQIDALVQKARERKRALRALNRSRPKLEKRLEILRSRRHEIEGEIDALTATLKAIAEGRPAELPAPSRRAAGAKGERRGWSAEARKRMSERQKQLWRQRKAKGAKTHA